MTRFGYVIRVGELRRFLQSCKRDQKCYVASQRGKFPVTRVTNGLVHDNYEVKDVTPLIGLETSYDASEVLSVDDLLGALTSWSDCVLVDSQDGFIDKVKTAYVQTPNAKEFAVVFYSHYETR